MVNSSRIWVSQGLPYANEAVILDSGNFILRNASGIIWQSFDYPTDTWLPGGLLGFRRSSNVEAKLVSWRNENDPGSGEYSLEMAQNGERELLIKGNGLLWRSGALQAGNFPSFPNSSLYFYYVKQDDTEYLAYNSSIESMMFRMVISSQGIIVVFVSGGFPNAWHVYLTQPTDSCSVYGRCGANGICDINKVPSCGCLYGYTPRVKQNFLNDFSQGCVRIRPLICYKDQTEFVKVGSIRLPANPEPLDVVRNGVCEFVCSGNCSCMAYALDRRGGCLLFMGDMLDLQRIENRDGAGDLYVRMDSRQGKKSGLIHNLVQ